MKLRGSLHEFLETDGLGGFTSGTLGLVRTRRYHALLLAAMQPPTGRLVLVNGFDATVETASGHYPISAQRYADGTLAPDGAQRIERFESVPWPKWRFLLEDGARIEQEIVIRHGQPIVCVLWRAIGAIGRVSISVRPFLSGRDYHALHAENGVLRMDAEAAGERVTWRSYDSVPAVSALSNGFYTHDPHWYRGFLYEEERERGLDHVEDLASPGSLRFDLTLHEGVLILGVHDALLANSRCALALAHEIRASEERRRASFASRLVQAADAYVVERGSGRTIVAGYPWFGDWGRDTFIAMRGLCLATRRFDDARAILLEWASAVSEGMLPNRFPDSGAAPEYNSVDASLWFVVVVHEMLLASARGDVLFAPNERERLIAAVLAIVAGHAAGTRYGIRLDADGLLRAGEAGVQLTWMDAKVGEWVVTPRIGKPVEVQALWLNALRIASTFDAKWAEVEVRGRRAFEAAFWNEDKGALFDVVDDNHEPGAKDGRLRPNQILAVGGLPFAVIEGEKARRIVDTVEKELLTPLGLRTLARDEAGYAARYEGGVRERDGAYHQGTVWPWLLGPFVEAWVRVRGDTAAAKQEAREQFLAPLLRHLDEAGLGHVSEIADGDAPHAPRGCPFQAWSVGEALRLQQILV